MKRSRFITLLFLSVFVVLGAAHSVAFAADAKSSTSSSTANSNPTTAGGGSVQGYAAASALQVGTIVQLTGAGASKVEVSTKGDQGHMYGVTVDRNKLSVTIDAGLPNQVYVATSGTFDTLVSSQGGDIKAGDYVTLSSVDGVAMKADSNAKAVFGRAAANFNSKSQGIGKVSLKDTTGKAAAQVVLGIVPVAIDVKTNPIQKSTKTNVPKFLQRLGEAVAEKPVGPLRIYLSIAITGICIIAAVVILYSGIRNSLISIGRNPLSKKSIFRALLEIILTAVLILIIGLFAVYLLLKL